MSATVRQCAETRAEKVGLTRFFRNPKVQPSEIFQTVAQQTARAAAGREVLLIQDTSEINYQAKSGRKRNLGRVGNGTDVGLFVHPELAVDARDGSVLGLAGGEIWRRVKTKAKNYRELPIEEKESLRWLSGPRSAQALLATASRVTIVSDREADIYELFARAPAAGFEVLGRVAHDRALIPNGRLFSGLAELPEAGRMSFELTARPGRPARMVELALRHGVFVLRQPRPGAAPSDPRELALHYVEAREVAAPPGQEPIVWRLATTHRVESFEDAARMVEFYRRRWIVEQLFRTLKSHGLGLEESFLEDGAALENLAATALVAAVRVMQLTQGRGEAGEGLAASRVFSARQIEVLARVTATREGRTAKQKNPHPAGSLAWAAWAVARLGGWNGYAKERPPGPITFTRGLERFHAIEEGFALASRDARKTDFQSTATYDIETHEKDVCAR